MKEATIIVTVFAVLFVGVFFWEDIKGLFKSNKTEKTASSLEKTDEKTKENEVAVPVLDKENIQIIETWELPEVLKEISGLGYLKASELVTVQDEKGSIFVYDLNKKEIVREISFAGPGDYEGVEVVEDMIYVVRADGLLYQVSDLDKTNPTVQQFQTTLSKKDNIEGLCYDKPNNRLLLAAKDAEDDDDGAKPIFGFDLGTKKLLDKPVYLVQGDEVQEKGKKKSKSGISPSAIAIHPTSQDVYITDGPKGKLIALNQNGIKHIYDLDSKRFPQPEGITFSPSGEIYISSEGGKGVGTIMKIRIIAE